ncbi:hypothetical protein Taro_047214 [Colocasia esculenta]|uniref:Uncharacterized protein n=1 Tax=Colocasia esculenta TaxID=4460 RepID=A0A843X6X6_COLES|nr:hypothetical protein [Colocasia esculenta]
MQAVTVSMERSPSPSSPPPTPPSPLPISVGPGHHSYRLSSSTSPSPPFSPSSGQSSPEDLPLLGQTSPHVERPTEQISAFSLDKLREDPPSPRRNRSFKESLKRLLLRCCCFCSPSLVLQADQEERLSG